MFHRKPLPALTTPNLVKNEITNNSEQPSCEFGRLLIARSAIPDAQEDLLPKILGTLETAEHFCNRPDDPQLMTLNQFFKGSLIAHTHPSHESEILVIG